MTSLLPRFDGAIWVTVLLITVGLPGEFNAQTATTPSAAVALTRIPELARQVWPGDFDRDGRTDLIGSVWEGGQPADLLIAEGAGDGTFDAPRSLGIAAEPFAISDINGDNRQDIVVWRPAGLAVLPATGNGTFGAPLPVDPADTWRQQHFALTADVNDDGHSDIVAPGTDAVGNAGVVIYPGHGDFTFGPQMFLPVTDPSSAIDGDFNGDGRPDLAVTQVCCSVWVFINNGGLLFSASEIVMDADLADITTGDLNGDGDLELVITEYFQGSFSAPGIVAVLIGRGDGTFEPKVAYEAGVKGEFTVVVGDFTRDGTLDVATGNLSVHRDDDFGAQMWDSISILEGTGTGTLTAPVTFALGNINGEEAYRDTQHQLNTNDLDDDGHTDLISSPGAILLNRVPVPNRAPVAFAGPDRTYASEDPIILLGEASDADGHWVSYTWTDEHGSRFHTAPMIAPVGLISGAQPGTYTYTLTVDDGQGGTAVDSVVIDVPDSLRGWTRLMNPRENERVPVDRPYRIGWEVSADSTITRFDLSYSVDAGRTFQPIDECRALAPSARECVWQDPAPVSDAALVRIVATYDGAAEWTDISRRFTLVEGPPTTLPEGWSSDDIGSVGAEGSATFDGTTFTVTGSGADIWNRADEFHYAHRSMSGDFDIVARVASVENVNQWTKAGLMVRNSVGASAAHAFLIATPSTTKGISLQSRPDDGASSVERARRAIAPPVWLKLMRRGSAVRTAYRASETDPWIDLPVVQVALGETVQVGLAVTSHVDGTLATATFDEVTMTPISGLPPGWSSADIGSVGAAGRATVDGDTFSIEGSGADIWGTLDEFHFLSQTVESSDYEVIARVVSVENVDRWTKAGLMIRSPGGASAAHASIFVTPTTEKGIAFQRRPTAGAASVHTAGPARTAPVWIRLVRAGESISAYYRAADAGPWQLVGTQILPQEGGVDEVGLAVTSHRDGTLATATFDTVSVDTVSVAASPE